MEQQQGEGAAVAALMQPAPVRSSTEEEEEEEESPPSLPPPYFLPVFTRAKNPLVAELIKLSRIKTDIKYAKQAKEPSQVVPWGSSNPRFAHVGDVSVPLLLESLRDIAEYHAGTWQINIAPRPRMGSR